MPELQYRIKLLKPSTIGTRHTADLKNSELYTHYLDELQRLRATEYLKDGAITEAQIDKMGRFKMEGDDRCWHFLLLNTNGTVIGCARYLLHQSDVTFDDLRLRHNPLNENPVYAKRLRLAAEKELQLARKQGLGYAELGGWAILREYRSTRAALETLLGSYLWAELIGHCLCSCTATHRNQSASILRRMGGTPLLDDDGLEIPAYYDEQYRCRMEILRFDSRRVPSRFKPILCQMKAHFGEGNLVSAPESMRTRILLHHREQKAASMASADPEVMLPNGPALLDRRKDKGGRANTTPQIYSAADLDRVRKTVPFSPGVALRALSALRNPTSSLSEMEDIVMKDPAISAELIRLANSGLYCRRFEVRSIRQALTTLGVDLVAWQVSALTFRKAYSAPELRKLWDHSVEATQLAHNICKGLPQVSKEEVTLAALVHDIGKLVLHGLGSEFQKKKNELLGEGISPLEAEAILCGFTHAEVGRDFLLSWSFPPDLAAAVSHHHDSSFAGNTFADILYLTELITKDDVLPSESDRAEQCCDRLGLEFKLFSVKGLVADPALSMLRFEAAA